jgi:hypothetical protein
MEILISLGIILFGLLGVAALLPVGRYDIMVAAKADRGAACARAAMRDIVVRGMLNPRDSQGNQNWNRNDLSPAPTLAMLMGGPVAIDPIGVGQGLPLAFPASSCLATPIQAYRITLGTGLYTGPPLTPVPMPYADALRICRWRDDLQFDVSGERTERPRQDFRLADPTQYGFPATSAKVGFGPAQTDAEKRNLWGTDNAGNAKYGPPEQIAEAEGAYSWLATVSPTSQPGECSVSVVVFYNRALTVDKELACGISLLGGGDVKLGIPASAPAGWVAPSGYSDWPTFSGAVREKLMALKSGEWILLRGLKVLPTTPPTTVYAFKWYRVAALGDFNPAVDATTGFTGERLATLAGPDWDPSFQPPTGTIEVGLFGSVEGGSVVGVYTETVEMAR